MHATDRHHGCALGATPFRIGSGRDCDLILRAGAAPVHATLRRIRSALALEVAPGATRVYVNARPVRRRALLRPGDCISVGVDTLILASDVLVAADADKPLPEIRPLAKDHVSLIGMRAVAGPLSGRRIAIDGGENLDARSLAGVEGVLRLRPVANGVRFDVLDADAGRAAVEVNGVQMARGLLVAGDQITWGQHRLILEMPTPRANAVLAPAPEPVRGSDPARDHHAEAWWLIATAALIAIILAVSLLIAW